MRPRSYPRTERGFQSKIRRIRKRIVRQQRLLTVMTNKCMAKCPQIDQQTLEVDEDSVSWMRGHDWLHPGGVATPPPPGCSQTAALVPGGIQYRSMRCEWAAQPGIVRMLELGLTTGTPSSPNVLRMDHYVRSGTR
jgi:hypothetical protein